MKLRVDVAARVVEWQGRFWAQLALLEMLFSGNGEVLPEKGVEGALRRLRCVVAEIEENHGALNRMQARELLDLVGHCVFLLWPADREMLARSEFRDELRNLRAALEGVFYLLLRKV